MFKQNRVIKWFRKWFWDLPEDVNSNDMEEMLDRINEKYT